MNELDAGPDQNGYPATIGPYRILDVLGGGTMGVVYLGEESEPVRRHVAVKVVRAGLNSREVLARFDAERQALAVMDHPGIAKVFAAGATPLGEQYFAMELVHGLSLTAYADSRKLSVDQRVALFIDVCHAVQHAHMKGVIHRDLKPSNVLVGERDSHPQPKIIDFGIAKALGQQLSSQSVVTRWGQPMGTPAYMSPETAESSSLDIDTRSDIFSLGVMLYELLVGSLPTDPDLVGMNVFLTQLITGATNPPAPSARLRTLGEGERLIATARRTDPAHLRRALRGDLDWIVMKALEPDRTRRYETANALAMDLQRHLSNEPVLARPRSAAYRSWKFVRRHRAGVFAGAVVALAVAASAVVSRVGLLRARAAEARAEQEALAATRVTDFLVELFRVSDPGEARGNAVTARELLERGVEKIGTDLAEQPLLRARILETMGTVHTSLGLYDPARVLLDSAVSLRERELGPDALPLAATLAARGEVARAKGDFDLALRDLRRALAIREAALPPDHPDLVKALSGLAGVHSKLKQNAAAESLYKRALAIEERVVSADSGQLARDRRNLGVVYWNAARYADAEPLFRSALAIQERRLPADHPEIAKTVNNLTVVLQTLGRYGDALPLYQRSLASLEKTLGPDHPNVASVVNNLGETYWRLNRYAEAEPLLRRALRIKERSLDAGHPTIAVTLNALAGVLRDEERYAEADPLYRRALAIREKAFVPPNADVAETLNDYAELMRRTGRTREADRFAARAARIQ
ncbi:MAG: serine/threonine-protein kinase [Gemmatimonadaceae bacterium]|jgi:non-specific serine/threonine protein kinase/serine/threonine-protein kinase